MIHYRTRLVGYGSVACLGILILIQAIWLIYPSYLIPATLESNYAMTVLVMLGASVVGIGIAGIIYDGKDE